MQRPEYHIITKVFKDQATISERDQVAHWIKSDGTNRREYLKLKSIWETYGEHHEAYEPNVKRAFERVEKGAHVGIGLMKVTYRIAASITLLLICGIAIYQILNSTGAEATMLSSLKDGTEFTLPDGSLVTLRKGAEITLSKDFNRKIRSLDLKGEAFFNVAKDEKKPFLVRIDELTIQVLGTSFLVAPGEKFIEVALFSGQVEVTSSNQQVTLEPNESAVFDGTLSKHDHISKNAISWLTQELVFRGESLGDVFTTLERHFKVKITASEAIREKRLTSTFIDQSLEEVLQAISLVHQLQIKKESTNHYYLSLK